MTRHATDRRLVTAVLAGLGALLLLPVLLTSGMMGFGPMMGGMWGHGTWGAGQAHGWMVLLGVLTRVVGLAVVVSGGYLLYRALTGADSETDQAIEDLRLAYARGELTEDEYEHRREKLQRDA